MVLGYAATLATGSVAFADPAKLAAASGSPTSGETAPAPPAAAAQPAPTTTVTVPHPEQDPLWQAEVRLGFGAEMGGSGSRMTTRSSPVTFEALASFAVQDDPRIMGFAGLIAEMYNRNSAGVTAGITYAPGGTNIRLSGGGIALVAPESLIGATASGGLCRKKRGPMRLCGDLQLTEYFAGGDLAAGHAVTQLQLVFGAVFDVL